MITKIFVGCTNNFERLCMYSIFVILAFKNGGGAFIIPYFCTYFLIGTPLAFLEMSIGQFTSRGAAAAFKMSRMFKGLGWSTTINSFLCSIYYNVIIAWILFYFFASFRSKLQWSDCGNWWNTERCANPEILNFSNSTIFCNSIHYHINCTMPTLPPEEYFDNYVLRRSDSLDNFGLPNWSLSLCLSLAWILVGLCIIQGIKSSGKVVYFTALFPYVVIFALIIRGVTLPGARVGITFYLKPNWNKIRQFDVWMAAASQVTYSLGIAFGSIISYASFNKFKTNYFRMCMLVTACDCFTSIFAGCAIFSVLGYMSFKTGVPIEQVAKAGPGLAFIAYPQALSIMPGGPFWAVIFFFMLLTLGLDSQFGMVDVVIASLLDTFKQLRQHKLFVSISYCIFCYLLALPMCAPIIFFSSIIRFQTPTEGNYEYPVYANVLGWLMHGKQLTVFNMKQPDTEWGPAKNEKRYGRYKPKIEQSTSINQSNMNDDDNNSAFKLENMPHIQL
ncbi:unnamed protein product [Rotaria sp. Silwood1]|nr:unnamed protein product [Rotaria sp. Silwood1]